MAIKSLYQIFYYHSNYLNSMKCRETSKVTTPKCNQSRSATPILRPKVDTTCLQFQHKRSKVTNSN
jgi:hypothetical protein